MITAPKLPRSQACTSPIQDSIAFVRTSASGSAGYYALTFESDQINPPGHVANQFILNSLLDACPPPLGRKDLVLCGGVQNAVNCSSLALSAPLTACADGAPALGNTLVGTSARGGLITLQSLWSNPDDASLAGCVTPGILASSVATGYQEANLSVSTGEPEPVKSMAKTKRPSKLALVTASLLATMLLLRGL